MAEKNLPALMIGGHAVTALGHPRATYDLNLLIPRSAAAPWEDELLGLGFRPFARSPNFQQYEARAGLPLPPVDLMLVDDAVFKTMNHARNDVRPIATPNVLTMIALKLHAIHQPTRDDAEKHWSDVLALAKAHHLTLDDPDFSTTVRRHGGEIAIQRLRAAET